MLVVVSALSFNLEMNMQTIYIETDKQILLIDPVKGTLLSSHPLPAATVCFAITPDGLTAYSLQIFQVVCV